MVPGASVSLPSEEGQGGVSKRLRGPRWGLLSAAGAIIVAFAGLATLASSGALEALPASDSWGLKDWLEIAIVLAFLLSVLFVPILVLTAFVLPQRRAVDPAWRHRLALYRTTSALARRRPDPAGAARACALLSDDGLRVAAILPGHSEAGRAAARVALASRGVAHEPVPEISVPSFYGVEDLAGARRHALVASRIRMICGGIGLLLLAVGFVLIGVNVFSIDPAVTRATEAGYSANVVAALDDQQFESVPAEIMAWPEMAGMQARDWAAKVAIGLTLPFALGLFFASWLRARPMRILFLRKFNDRRLGKAYNRLVTNNLQRFGHVIALADKRLRRSTLAWFGGMLLGSVQSLPSFVFTVVSIPFLIVLRMTDRTRWGPAFVGAPRDFRLLAKRLFDRLELNVETTFISKGYLVRTTDDWWRIVVKMMMDSADVIVLDASNVTDGTAWEIDAVTRFGLWHRVVRVTLDAEIAEAEAAFAQAPAAPLFTYDASGHLGDEAAFREAVFTALEQSVRARET